MYCIYLRKSRADREAEAQGAGETLARHKATLIDLAHKLNLTIGDIKEEIVSGDSISARPKMQELLTEVEAGIWDGVLVMEIERLARGDTIDQGIVAQAFKFSNTLIITPTKTYNPDNEFDEEYLEFGLFMSRREYKTIKRRLQAGRVASAKEGKFTGNVAPYGYDRVKVDGGKGYTLAPNSHEAPVVKMIFDWYTKGIVNEHGTYERIGAAKITRKLNEMKIKPRKSDAWVIATVQTILRNKIYIGIIQYNRRKQVKSIVNNTVAITRPRNKQPDEYIGLHPAIIDEDVFYTAQYYLEKSSTRQHKNTALSNPLAGIVICGDCGRRMIRRTYSSGQPSSLICPVTHCHNVSSYFDLVEKRILSSLQDWVNDYEIKVASNNIDYDASIQNKRSLIKEYKKTLKDLKESKERIYSFLEQGIYDTNVFLERSKLVEEKIISCQTTIDDIQAEIDLETKQQEQQNSIIPKVTNLLNVYDGLPDAQSKNNILKEVLDKVIYHKTVKGKKSGVDRDSFSLELYPKINDNK